ncbi:heat shock transcription factor, Y-linked-like [Tympanuchus pallidicinctus]|uniref:heat shock transcription factor, Y-linked-like n=1 Tax=Tympanuchus pallidicinctus TaxID=109042 RepID=UPI00228745DB|nr:heat shock transcription factor, Y-linked-like [Tympanuchus pallidicinctus]
METSSSETPGVSVPNAGLADPASSVPQRRGKRTARDAALGPTREEDTSQGSQEQSCAKRQRLDLSTKGSCKAHDSACCFLTKLRNIVDSDCFQSIWWGDDENTIVIEETLFKTEVLGRTGPLHNLSIGCMKAFVRQLHLHGFFIVDSDLPTAASRAKCPAGAAASVCIALLLQPQFQERVPMSAEMVQAERWRTKESISCIPTRAGFRGGPREQPSKQTARPCSISGQ